LSELYATTGQFAEAINELKKASPNPVPGNWNADARGYSMLELAAPSRFNKLSTDAVSYAIAGNRNKALESLEKGLADGENELLLSIRYPAFDSLRSDPRFVEVIRKMGLPQ
jgi:tetratricopeptide (TPR) repeat protein